MRHRYTISTFFIGLFLFITLFGGCETTNHANRTESHTVGSDPIIEDVIPLIETLYLDWHQLDQIYKDIKFLERGFLFDPDDRQLGHIQKASLYIQDASVRVLHQWEHLSVIHYICPESLRDYFTLREKGLTAAINAVGYDEMFLMIYRASIDQKEVLADIERALTSMQELTATMNRIRDAIIPLSNLKGVASAPN